MTAINWERLSAYSEIHDMPHYSESNSIPLTNAGHLSDLPIWISADSHSDTRHILVI